jgi:hypothetical protein
MRAPVKSRGSSLVGSPGWSAPVLLYFFERPHICHAAAFLKHQSQGTVMVCPTVGKYRLQVATVFPDASVSTLLLS